MKLGRPAAFRLLYKFKMIRTYADLDPKFDAIWENCKPRPFLQLAATGRNLVAAASWLNDVRDELEFEKAFNRFGGLLVRFIASSQQAYDMGLFAGVDESTRSSPRELRDLDRALAYPSHRISCLVAVRQLAEATACFIGTRRFPSYYLPWPHMFHLLFEQPVLAGIFHGVDLTKWAPMRREPNQRFTALAKSAGFLRIGIKPCCEALEYEAGELWTDSLLRGLEKDRLRECVNRLERLLSFLTLPAQEPWVLQELASIGSTDSMQAILKEVFRHDVRLVAESDGLDLRELGQYARALDDLPKDVLALTHGWIKKRRYLVALPNFQYFIPRVSSTALEDAVADPVEFLRKRWRDASKSAAAENHRLHLSRVKAAAVDIRFQDTMEHVLANLAGETFAYAISNSVGTSPEVSIFIAGCFGIVVDVVMSLKKG